MWKDINGIKSKKRDEKEKVAMSGKREERREEKKEGAPKKYEARKCGRWRSDRSRDKLGHATAGGLVLVSFLSGVLPHLL